MNVAILFFGRIKYYERKYLLNILDKSNNIDIFYSCCDEPQELINNFIKIYNPKGIINEQISNDIFDKYEIIFNTNKTTLTYHFINKKRVYEMCKKYMKTNNIKYDLLISSRLDINPNFELNLTHFKNGICYIPEGEDHTGINDRFAIGDINVIESYMLIFDNCANLLDNKICGLHPETLTLANLKNKNIKIERFNCSTTLIR